ncbi:chymotrypsinogen A-like [Triplophysa rosa]|uniref:Peptidase S1 domain-containing protein n=1 Tax=Triplophysa rosa TaxID=992332 RepID=A0A9W7WKH4_TRIRA|nr:chymotrypsinogen A-like [Triplophysa rosa]KAI7803134.1 hypothetical protein IRJ41_003184 [Triplophysa rosa]
MSSVSIQNMTMRSIKVLCVAVTVLLNLKGSFCQLDVCGQAPFNTKIVGGVDAIVGSWPWQVSICDAYQFHFCGGSLINKNWVLSAAHCFQSINRSHIMIYLGRQNQNGSNPHEINRTVIQLINHPDYNTITNDNDIALLRLSSSVYFTDYIKPVCLAAAGSVFDEGLSSWVTGWGDTGNGTSPDILQEVEIPIVSNFYCNMAYNSDITDNMLCAGLINVGGKDSCQGDSGGPLVSKQNSKWIQSGIVSFGIVCADPRFPGVYARVSKYQDWIKSHIVSNQPGFVAFHSNIYVIFSGSSPSLYLFSLSLTFSIIPLIFCVFF